MQTLSPHRQRGSPSSAASNPTFPSATPSSTTSQYSSTLSPAIPRTSQRPGTSSARQATSDGSFGQYPSGSSSAYTATPRQGFELSSPSWSAQRAYTLEAGAGEGGSLPANLLRKKSVTRRPSLGDLRSYSPQQALSASPLVTRFKSLRRRASSSIALREAHGSGAAPGVRRPTPPGAGAGAAAAASASASASTSAAIIDNSNPPALPEYALSSSAKLSRSTDGRILSPRPPSRTTFGSMDSGGRMMSRTGTMPTNGSMSAGSGMMPPPSSMGMQSESAMVHQHIQDMANKRISTLEYLRKAHEGRVYWFNTLLFDKPDLARMAYFDTRRLARRATNYLLLGLSLPTVVDLNSTTPLEFLRSLNLLLSEFDTFQSLHPETGGGSSGLGRARIPNLNVFRRATPSVKARRSSSANNEILYEDGAMPNGSGGGSVSGAASSSAGTSIMNGLGGSASVVSFGQSEADLLPGEEYVHLLTPSLPFDPDFFETFATLCDVLIDAYTRLLSLLRTPRECTAAVAELFTKADSRVRKIIVQGIVKEFEDTSRNGVRTEVANVGKIVLGGLM